MLKAKDLLAVLGREVSARLVNISGSGCLIATSSRLAEGTSGRLHVTIDGIEYSDDVRVVRCTPLHGASEYNLGLEFLWTSAPGERSMRRVTTLLQAAAGTAAPQTVDVQFAGSALAEGRTVGGHSRS